MHRIHSLLSREISNIHAAALILGAAGFLSKILGVLRDRLLAAHFGAGKELDIYYAAFQIPDFMSVIFLLGAGSAAILPVLQERMQKSPREARLLIGRLSLLFVFAAIILIGLALFFLRPLLHFMVPGFSGEDLDRAVKISRIILLSPLFLGLSSIFSSVVQSFHRFFAYAAAPIAYNLGIIAGILFFVPRFGFAGLGFGVVLGAILHFSIQFATARKLGFSLSLEYFPADIRLWFKDSDIRRVIMLSLPRVAALSFSQITVFFIVALGSLLSAGSIAVFNLAYNLYFVPVGIFGLSYSVALFPRLSLSYVRRDGKIFFEELYLGIRTILFWVMPSAALFIVLRAHIVRVAFGAGLFSWEDTRLTAASLAIFAAVMGAGSLNMLLIRAFYALEKTAMPLVVDALTLAVSLISAYSITNILKRDGNMLRELLRIADLPHGEAVGLAAGFAVGIVFNVVMLYAALLFAGKKEFRAAYGLPYIAIFKIIAASVAAGIVAYLVLQGFAETIELRGFLSVFLHGSLAGVCGIIAYGVTLYAMGSEDLLNVTKSLQKKLLRFGVLPKSWDGETAGKV